MRYLNKQKVGELDFVIQQGNKVIPLEIKSGKDYKQHAALDNALAVGDWNLEQALVFCFGNVEQKGKITYLPFYMIMFFQQISLDNLVVDFNVEI